MITLLTDDSYFPGVQALLKSLQKVSCKFPFEVLIGPNVSKSVEKRVQRLQGCSGTIPVEQIISPYTHSSEISNHTPSWTQSHLTKLNLWKVLKYDLIFYIDADCIVMENFDDIFEIGVEFAAAPDIFPPDRFNAGVMLLKPDLVVFESMVTKIGTLTSYDGGDTGFLNAFFSDWYQRGSNSRLPFGYNAQRTLHWFTNSKNPGYWQSIQPLKIIHYSSSPKPWEVSASSAKSTSSSSPSIGELELLWWQTFTDNGF